MLNTSVLVVKFLTQPDWIACVRVTSASVVDLDLRPPSWLGWIKSLAIMLNCSLSPMTLLMSLPIVLRKMMGLNDLGESYDFLFGLGITIVVETLKCDSQ